MGDDDRPFYPAQSTLNRPPAPPITRPRRARKSTLKATDYGSDDDDPRPTRQGVRLSLRNRNHQSHHDDLHRGPGDETRIGWDRELDSDDEPLAVEEQFILRVPPKLAPQLREQVAGKNVGPDVWFKFLDSRRAVFHAGETSYGAKLVDLPTLTESQRLTGNGGQTIKVADIHQMLLVEDPIEDETRLTRDKGFNIEDFIYPHGLTPPLQHVRKRRFRKRVNNRTIEVVEQAVEQLLEADSNAQQSNYEILNYELASDDEGGPRGFEPAQGSDEEDIGGPTPRETAGDNSSIQGPDDGPPNQQPGDSDSDSDSDEEGSGYDEDLAAEINAGLQGMNETDEEEDSDDGLFGGEDEDEDDDEEEEDDVETVEQKKRIKLLASEIADLERAITTKEGEIAKQTNPIFKKRFEDVLKKVTTDRDAKRAQHAAAVRELERKKEQQATAANPAPPAAEPAEEGIDAFTVPPVAGDAELPPAPPPAELGEGSNMHIVPPSSPPAAEVDMDVDLTVDEPAAPDLDVMMDQA